jgi:pimeloyl-ACP methyl ester carboxylesterase
MKLHTRILGESGQPLIILHGLMGSSDNWFTLGKQLAENYQVFLVDQRNHGLSAWNEEWHYDAMAEDLKELIIEHQIQTPIVIGHSMGGKTAMLFAGKYPEMLAKLVVVDIAPRYYAPHHQTILEGLNSIHLASLTSRQEADNQLAMYIKELDTRQFLLKNLYRQPNNSFAWRMNLEVITAQIEQVGKSFPENLQYVGKTLFIRGEKSNYITQADEASILQSFPQAEIATVAHAGHWVQAEQPQGFLNVLIPFLNI